jgi:hypothetical protein
MYSIYIPRISTIFEQKDIDRILAQYNIASVRRVDFVPLPMTNDDWCSAFVHCFYIEPSVWNVLNGGKGYRLQATLKEYWILLKNKNPIVDTRLNIHQVVENARLLEERVLKQTEQIDRLQETIYQLLGKTYNTEIEMDQIYSQYNYMKWGNFCNNRWIYSEEEALEEERERKEREREEREREEYEYEYEEDFQGYESDPYNINYRSD